MTKAERDTYGAELVQHGHNPTKEVPATAVLGAMLMHAAKAFDAKHPDQNQVNAAQDFLNKHS